MKKVILVDLDNLNSARCVSVTASMKDVDTKVVFFGAKNRLKPDGTVDKGKSPLHKRIEEVELLSATHPETFFCFWVEPGQDAADIALLRYIGDRFVEWAITEVDTVIVASADASCAFALFSLSGRFKVWHMFPQSKLDFCDLSAKSLKQGIYIPKLIIKNT